MSIFSVYNSHICRIIINSNIKSCGFASPYAVICHFKCKYSIRKFNIGRNHAVCCSP
ncbi:MAG: YSIRK-type signal peptide-containing protein [Prevotellaceae bacterium]|nr:YSIRK-type signal peptide-containing protein [Prevotellaceae bacterium]